MLKVIVPKQKVSASWAFRVLIKLLIAIAYYVGMTAPELKDLLKGSNIELEITD